MQKDIRDTYASIELDCGNSFLGLKMRNLKEVFFTKIIKSVEKRNQRNYF